uniref:Signal recognition particle subunit SRP68 n=1 Tax=Meloidogyne javanica TaxID=6303 RepID=A0A915LKD9_MELJA
MVGADNELDFKISAMIGFTMPTTSLQRQTPKSGHLEFDADKNSFIISFKHIRKTVFIPMNCIVPPTKEACPRGCIYTFDFNIRDFKYKQCFLRNMSDDDKKLLHDHIIKTVGVKKKLFNTSTSSTKCAVPIEPQKVKESKVCLTPKPTKRLVPLGYDSIPSRRTKFVMPPEPRKVEDSERIMTPEPQKTIMPQDLESVPEEYMREDVRTRLSENKEVRTEVWRKWDYDEVVNDSFEENAFPSQPMRCVLTAPPNENSLTGEYMRDDFWDRLSKNENVRTGVCGEWVKGKDEHLTIEGLLCLKDGEWVNGDLIDAYLHHICRRRNGTNLVSPHIDNKENTDGYAQAGRIQYIPTFALESYKIKKQISSKWYWKMENVELVLAPVHINKCHWAMSVTRMQKKEIIVMDSMNNGIAGSTKKDFMNTLLNILMDAADQFEMDIGKREEWTLKEWLDVPQQRNGIDCVIKLGTINNSMSSKEPSEPKPILNSLNILQLIRTAQQKHGLRHENYQRYRGYCARRVERIRKSLKFTHHYKCLPKRSGKFIARTVTSELVGDKRYLELIVFEIERCWAHAMEFKFEALDDPLSRKKFGMRQKFRKAAKWAQFLCGLIKDNELVEEVTKLEARAYISFIQGSLELELRNWKEAAEQFNAS